MPAKKLKKDKHEHEDKQIRVGINFHNEMEDIKKKRIELKIDKKNMIPKHELWDRIKDDLINFDFDERI